MLNQTLNHTLPTTYPAFSYSLYVLDNMIVSKNKINLRLYVRGFI